MDADYSVNIANRFSLDFECSDPFEIITKPKAPAPCETEEKENIKTKAKTAPKKPKTEKASQSESRVLL